MIMKMILSSCDFINDNSSVIYTKLNKHKF